MSRIFYYHLLILKKVNVFVIKMSISTSLIMNIKNISISINA